MVNVTLSIPEDTYRIMRKHPEIKWTEVMRQAAVRFAERLETDPVRKYTYAKSQEDWADAEELFRF